MERIKIGKEFKKFYDEYYSNKSTRIEEWRELVSCDKIERIIHLTKQIPHNSVLDIGCGEGALLEILDKYKFAKSLYGIEISYSAVKRVLDRNIPTLVKCELFDGYNIPYKDKFFDLSILSHVLEHVEHPRLLLKEASRVSNFIFIEVPLSYNILFRKHYKESLRIGHINFFSQQLLDALLETTGLEILRKQVYMDFSRNIYKYLYGNKGMIKYFIKKIALKLLPKLSQKIFGYVYCVICK